MAEHVYIALADLRLIARDSGELVYSTETHSVFVDANQWPPHVVQRTGQVRFAARDNGGGELDGAWRVYTTTDPGAQRWTIQLFKTIVAELPVREDPDPMPFRDFAPFMAELDQEIRDRERESWHRIESLHVCGPLPVAVPRYCGLGEQRHPWAQRGGTWAEELSLPPLERTLAEAAMISPVDCTRLADGPGVMAWQDRLYLPLADGFFEYCAATVTLGSDRGALVPASGGGLFTLQGTQLVEVTIDSVREHLPGIGVEALQGGPDETLIVKTSEGLLLYDPAKCELADLGPVVGAREIATATKLGDLILFEREIAYLWRITRAELAAIPRRPVEAASEPPSPPVRILDARGAASRPITAAVGDIIIICADDAVRFWNLDIPFAKVALSALAIAVRGDRVAVLDAGGVLHELEATTGAVLASQPITERPRSLARAADRWIVIAEDAVWTVGQQIERIEIAGAIAAAADPDGTIVLLAEDRRLARWEGGQLFDIPESVEQLVAIAPNGDRKFVCAGERNLFLLDLAQLELEALYEQNETPFIAASPNGKVVAWATVQSVSIATLEGTKLEVIESSHYPDTFIEPDGEPLRIRGLAFLDDNRVTVAISAGFGGEMLDFVSKTTKKLDPHPGDRRNRFFHRYAGVVYVAEDP